MSKHVRRVCVVVVGVASLAMPPTVLADPIVTIDPAGAFVSESLGNLTFSSTSFTLSCAATLEGETTSETFNEPDTLVAFVDEGTVESCSRGSASFLFAEPDEWELVLAAEAELSRSPTLVTLRLEASQIEFDVSGLTCQYQGDIPLSLPASGTPLQTGLLTVLTNRVSKTAGSFLCPASGSLAGTLTFSPPDSIDDSTVTLTADPRKREFAASSGSHEFTFVNRSGADQTVRSATLWRGDRGWRIRSHTCAEGANLERPRVLKDADVDADRSFCRVLIDFTSPGTRHTRYEYILVKGDPGVTAVLGIAQMEGR